MSVVHGRSAYVHGTCRCPVCAQANREYAAELRARKSGTLAPGDPRHGTVNGYSNYRCRCQACTRANTDAWWRWSQP